MAEAEKPLSQRSAALRKVFVHPAIRDYRAAIFHKLGKAGFHFFFSFINPSGTHAGENTRQELERFPYPYFQARELRAPVHNISFDLIRIFRYDLVIFSCLTSVPFLLLATPLKLLGKRVLLFDETWRYQYEVGRYRRLLPVVRFLVRRCVDAFVPAGSMAAAMFENDFGIPKSRLFIAYNTTLDLTGAGTSTEKAAQVRERISSAAQGRTVILYLARIVQYKGLDVLISALALLPDEACLIVVGSGPFQEECESLVEKLGLGHQVHFLGDCLTEDVAYYYRAADIFVLPSRFVLTDPVNCESWGFTVNEAMSLGIPVVATDAVGAAHDLIRDGETGMLARENDAESLANKLRFLLEDSERREKIGANGRKWLMERCIYEQNAGAILSAVEYALERGSHPHCPNALT